ncbi:B3 domain-containing protein Os01g0234100 isoform X1 [Beta vulgaris subsp. vulgaris]|uniref:B3 domain-containing protein Os01g0234100 isoform X1 n=2 Tax=Beta vulgaris subsp. vulgaris TaxID=3555 RepID=UPI0020374E3D|nr:B3 domain-containing protein Os01g0234100 isoform X1 [Beta vulgaris subsp. vulgaris]
MWVLYMQVKKNKLRDEKINKENRGKLKRLRANKIRRKYLRLYQVLGKCRMVQVKRVQSKMIIEHPATISTMKQLLESHVSGGYNLALPTPFCRAHLPPKDTIMVLETKTGEQYEAKYLARHFRLSGGWRKFARDNKLEAGDVVVFTLVEATKFKVYIIRTSANEVTLPVHLLNPVNHVKQSVSSQTTNQKLIIYRRGKEHQVAEIYNRRSLRLKLKNAGAGSMLYPGEILFSNITNFEDFKAIMHELLQNHKLPYSTLHDYYELCCSQNAFLHAHLLKGINPTLNYQIITEAIKRIIFETVSIANALKTCKLSTFLYKCSLWEDTLNAYEGLGMNVGFLLARLHHLRSLVFSLEGAADHRSRYKEASHERGLAEGEVKKLKLVLAKLRKVSDDMKLKPLEDKYREGNSWLACVQAEITNLEVLLAELQKFFSQYDAHIESLKLNAKRHEFEFREELSAPW